MAQKIVWSVEAQQEFEQVVTYLLSEWSSSIAEKFIEILEKKLYILSLHPFIGMASEKNKEIRSILITKHNKLYYKVDKDTIQVLNLFDTRRKETKN